MYIFKQSIGLDNAESRWCWLNTTVGILGAGASAATGLITRAASKGVEIGQVNSTQNTFKHQTVKFNKHHILDGTNCI